MNKTPRLEPRTLKGFRDFTPDVMIAKEAMIDTIRSVLRSFGFVPIDTPALEYAEILLGKMGAENEKQVYRFTDQGGRDVALRFDLTVPFARFAAQHVRALGTPFKRYHLGPVWRGENTARGRFREFWQCDFDTIGTSSPLADLETVLVIDHLLVALGITRFEIRISDRAILGGLLDELGLGESAAEVLRALDKLARFGRDQVEAELEREAGAARSAIAAIFAFAEERGDPEEVLGRLEHRFAGNARAAEGIKRLAFVMAGLRAAGLPPGRVVLDLGLARGLDYYTGTIVETVLMDERELGSICSGGRYDQLASLYTRDVLPGVGASLGLDRLLDSLERLGVAAKTGATAQVLVTVLDRERRLDYLKMAEEIRANGIAAELYLDERKLDRQLQYAARKGMALAVIAGEEEFKRGTVAIKDLRSGTQESDVPRGRLVEAISNALGKRGAKSE